jgi:hypothetical protein
MQDIKTPLDTRPKSVAIIGMGPSSSEFFLYNWKKKDLFRVDEVWGVNSTLGSVVMDKCFIMDDLKGVEQRYPQWGDKLKLANTPIITCKTYPDYPAAYAYPLDDVLKVCPDGYFTNTPCYMVGYALAIGVQELWLFGCDYSYPGSSGVEAGAMNLAFLLGYAKGMKRLHYRIPGSSTLLDANLVRQVKDEKTGAMVVRYPLYGYEFNPGEAARLAKFNQASQTDLLLADRQPKNIKAQEALQGPVPAPIPNQPKEGTIHG